MSLLSRASGNTKARRKNDFYATIDRRAVEALARFLPPGTVYAEPCAGAGDLVVLLEAIGLVCEWGLELEPQQPSSGSADADPLPPCPRNRWPIAQGNALSLTRGDIGGATVFVSNPPWHRPLLHPLIEHLAALAPCWFLFDAGWKHTQAAGELGPICTDVVSVGRLRWFEDGDHDSTNDCAWYRFDATGGADPGQGTRFHWRPNARAAQLRLGW
jgi:hypothetical protein